MSEEKTKKDLAQEESKVETLNVKVDASEIREVVKDLADAIGKIPKPEERQPLPGPIGKEYSEKEEKDLAGYRITTAILKQAEAMLGRRPLDGIEREMHDEAVRRNKEAGIGIEGLGIPSIIHSRAPMKAITDASGGYSVATELVGFIDTLKNNLVLVKAGAKLMTGLRGDVAIPTLSANSSSTWVSEGGTATESNPTFSQVTMTPERLTTYSSFTRQLLRQSSLDIEQIVRNNLFYSVANALETAAFTTDGTSQTPIGLANLSINDGHHGSNGTLMNWTNIVGMEKMVAIDNALAGKLAYITNATTAGSLKTTVKNTYQGGFIWENYTPIAPYGMINGYPAYITNVLTNSTTNRVFFGNWADFYIGQWGDAIDLIVNPYSGDTTGTIRVVMSGYYDVNVGQLNSFCQIKNLRT
jgi:HK97 family phage major capsid protein